METIELVGSATILFLLGDGSKYLLLILVIVASSPVQVGLYCPTLFKQNARHCGKLLGIVLSVSVL